MAEELRRMIPWANWIVTYYGHWEEERWRRDAMAALLLGRCAAQVGTDVSTSSLPLQ